MSQTAGILKYLLGIRVALWGACNYAYDWRAPLITRLTATGLNPEVIFNPDKGADWKEEDAYVEDLVKNLTWVHYFFIGSQNRSTVSSLELLAHMLFGWNVIPVIEKMEAGQSLDGQPVSEFEATFFNSVRTFLAEACIALNVQYFDTVPQSFPHLPASEAEMQTSRFKDISSMQKKAIRVLLRNYDYEEYVTTHTIEIDPHDPFKAQWDTMMAVAAVLTRTGANDEVTILIPDVTKWEGYERDGVIVTGRLFKDLKRIVDPYLETLVARAKCKVRIIRR